MKLGTPSEILAEVQIDKIQALLGTINMPPAKHVDALSMRGEYHIIALLQFGTDDDLILRVSGLHVPAVKTQHEVAVISWLQQNTAIPVPSVVHYDATISNPLGREYILQERVPGQSLDAVWPKLKEDEKLDVLDFVIDVLQQLRRHEWSHIDSLQPSENNIIPGQVLDERFWEPRDIELFFPGETLESINPLGPFASFVEYSIVRLETYMYCIRKQPTLAFMRPHLAEIAQFISAVKENADKLNQTKLYLAHRDLHMANIMYDVETKKVTGILDWEFSVVMPLQQGDILRALMWDGKNDAESSALRKELIDTMKKRCEARRIDLFSEYDFGSEDQEEMQEVVDLL